MDYVSKFNVLGHSPIYVKDEEARTLIATEANLREAEDTALGAAIETERAARNAADEEIRQTISTLGSGYYKNVRDYGAVGDGVTDDYQAFADAYTAADYGSYIIIPEGRYYLSQNPQGAKPITWLMDQGVTFTGAGAGSTSTGAGGFGTTYISNPWLNTSGLYGILNTNDRNSPGGVTNAISYEMQPIQVGSGGTLSRDWRNLMYLGSNTGADTAAYNNMANVEIMNQVLNITAQKGIMMEMDLNTYRTIPDFSTALFITGGGTVNTPSTAIDIQRDTWLTHWTNALSIRKAETVMFAEMCINGFIMNRYNDGTQEGNAFQLRTRDGSQELCAIGADGWIRAQGFNVIGSGVQSGNITPTGYITIRVNGVDHKVAVE